MVRRPFSTTLLMAAPLLMAFQSEGISRVSLNVAFMSGWSKQGNTLRAWSGTNSVYIYSSLRFSDLSLLVKSR